MRYASFALALGLLVPLAPAAAQRFEGEVRQRTITIQAGALDALLYGDADEPDVEDETEEAMLRRMMARLFEVPAARLLEAADEDGEVEEFTVFVKGNKIAAGGHTGDGPPFLVIVDLDAQSITMVNERERYFVRMTNDEYHRELVSMGVTPPPDGPEGAQPLVRPLGRNATISGATCRGFEVSDEEGGLTWGWVTDAYPGLAATIRDYGRRMDQMFGDAAADVSAEDVLFERGFPMRLQRLRGGGMFESYEIEDVLSVQAKPIPDSAFEVPAGFAQKTFRELMGR